MIINDQLARVTEQVSNIYWKETTHVGRINAIVQYILERDQLMEIVKDNSPKCICPSDGHSELCPIHKRNSSPR